MFAFKTFTVYLSSSLSVAVVTDHQILSHNFQKEDINGRLALWQDFLAEFGFHYENCKGASNKVADYHSCYPATPAVAEDEEGGKLVCIYL